ncbi:hypothetical protein ES705_44718 [subsurface metagenome]
MTETHLHVATSLAGIPQTKKGNPIPGKFEENDEHDCVAEFLYTYDLAGRGWTVDTQLHIAAHAVVVKGYSLTLYSNTDTQTAGWFELGSYTGNVIPSFALDASNYSGSGVWANSADISSPNSAWYDEILLADAIWISSTDGLEGNAGYDQWRLFKEEFNIPEWAINIMGSIQFTADNAVATYLGSNVIAETSYVYAIGPPIPRDDSVRHFKNLYGPYDFFPQTGLNSLNFVVRNYYSTSGSNPTGLLYRAEISYDQSETAWATGFDFPGKNWATYFKYLVQPVLIEEISIDPKNPAGATSTAILENEVEYEFVVSGTWENRTWERVDAKYCSADSWATPGTEAPSGGYPDELLELYVDGGSVDWGAYSDTHIYTLDFTGSGFAVNFAVHDTYYGDNVNSTMQVEIWTK